MDGGLLHILVEAFLGVFLTLQAYLIKRLWNEKPDRIEVIKTIRDALTDFKELDKELDEGRLGVIVAKIDEREKYASERHSQNLRRLEGLEDGVKKLLERRER
jgi:hypothetical protein